jgi:hypothetical protein
MSSPAFLSDQRLSEACRSSSSVPLAAIAIDQLKELSLLIKRR